MKTSILQRGVKITFALVVNSAPAMRRGWHSSCALGQERLVKRSERAISGLSADGKCPTFVLAVSERGEESGRSDLFLQIRLTFRLLSEFLREKKFSPEKKA